MFRLYKVRIKLIVICLVLFLFILIEGNKYLFQDEENSSSTTTVDSDVINSDFDSSSFITTIRNSELQTKTQCKERVLILSNTSLPVTGLVSFPGSGNTWLRHLLQQLTGNILNNRLHKLFTLYMYMYKVYYLKLKKMVNELNNLH